MERRQQNSDQCAALTHTAWPRSLSLDAAFNLGVLLRRRPGLD